MSFFSKNKNMNSGFIINTDDDNVKISGDKNLAPHAITAEEVSSFWDLGDSTQPVTTTGALDSLKKRMNVTDVPTRPTVEKVKLSTQEENTSPEKPADISFKNQIQKPESDTQINTISQKTLIEKVKRYTVDEQGHDMSQPSEPLYQLESVAEILKNNGEHAMKSLSKKYGLDISFDDLGKNKSTDTSSNKTKKEENIKPKKFENITSPTPAFEKMVNDSEKRETQELYESLFPTEKQTDTHNISMPDISDIDTHEVGINKTSVTNTATIRFTPIKDHKGNTDHITVSSITKQIDLSDSIPEDISSHSAVQTLEQSDFEKFLPQKEMVDLPSGKKLMRSLAVKKRSGFIACLISALSVILLSVFLIPPVFDFIIGNPKNAMFICSAFLFISILANITMFADFKNLIKKGCGFDVLVSLCSVLTLSLGITSALTQSNAYYSILLCSIILFIRAVCKFKELSATIGNLKQILNERPKKAVTLINDPATTFAMAKNSIESDVLISAHRNTNFVTDYMKHTDYALRLFGRGSLIFHFTLVFCLLSGVMAYFYYQSIYEAVYSAAMLSCIVSMPSLFFIDSLPLSSAAKKLNARGAMIAGIHGAEKIELSNAAVIGINDIFPNGSIKMYSMKVLSDNNIDDTLLRAASLTATVSSPLEAIFKQIVGSNSSYSIPDSDTVKYEKNLGISGWVNNELLFIGNRSLMQAHGIAIPSLEIDKKILRKGYFPVYVATADTACALVVIQYDVKPEIAKELRKVTELGLTLLIENCDPNITEEMICDYFGLYEDSVKIMSNAGVYMYKNATLHINKCSAPAAYRGSNLNLIKIINCASMIKKSNKLLTIIYALFVIFGIMYFIYAAFSGMATIPSPITILCYELTVTVLSIIGFLIRKP